MSSTVYQIQIPACVDGAELSGLLSCADFLGVWEEGGVLTIYWQGSEESILLKVQKALAQLDVDMLVSATDVQGVIAQDWNAQWAASVKPIRIGQRIGIRPSWETLNLPENGIEIILDPKQAFGTGHHATTHLLLEWLETISALGNARVLDVGTGSGILSMVALRLGALSALGLDNDAVAIDCAKDYAMINGFGPELDLRCARLEELGPETFEFIVANIDRKTILEISPGLSRVRSSSTQLFLSGLLEEDATDVVEHMIQQGWAHQAVHARDGWIALQFKVAPSI